MCKFCVSCSPSTRVRFHLRCAFAAKFVRNFQFVGNYRIIWLVHRCSHSIALHFRYFRVDGNRTKQNEFTAISDISLILAKRNDFSTFVFRSMRILRVASLAESAQRVHITILLHMFLRWMSLKKLAFGMMLFKCGEIQALSAALTTFSHFVWKCFDFMACDGPGNIQHNTENRTPIFSFALIISIITKQRGKRPSAEHVIEIFSKYSQRGMRRSAFSSTRTILPRTLKTKKMVLRWKQFISEPKMNLDSLRVSRDSHAYWSALNLNSIILFLVRRRILHAKHFVERTQQHEQSSIPF